MCFNMVFHYVYDGIWTNHLVFLIQVLTRDIHTKVVYNIQGLSVLLHLHYLLLLYQVYAGVSHVDIYLQIIQDGFVCYVNLAGHKINDKEIQNSRSLLSSIMIQYYNKLCFNIIWIRLSNVNTPQAIHLFKQIVYLFSVNISFYF